MGSMTITYGAASLSAVLAVALAALAERFGSTPIPAAQGSTAPFAGQPAAAAAHAHNTMTHRVDRKADDWFRPRGRRL